MPRDVTDDTERMPFGEYPPLRDQICDEGRRSYNRRTPISQYAWHVWGLLVADGLSLAVLVTAAEQHDEIDERPDSASAERHELYDAYYGLAGIEA